MESVGSLTFIWLLCKHLRELHKFQSRVLAPCCTEPGNSLQLKAQREAIRLTRHWASMDLLLQMVSNLSSQQLSLSGGNPTSICMGMVLLHPRARLCAAGTWDTEVSQPPREPPSSPSSTNVLGCTCVYTIRVRQHLLKLTLQAGEHCPGYKFYTYRASHPEKSTSTITMMIIIIIINKKACGCGWGYGLVLNLAVPS